MDIYREQPTSSLNKSRFIVVGAVLVIVVVGVILFTETTESRVKMDLLRVATVQRGNFEIVVRAPGSLVPKELRWVAAEVGGSVEQVAVLPGATVRPGDIIIELSNPELLTQLEERQWDLEATEAQHRAELLELESRILDQQLAELNAKNSFESSEMTYLAQQTLRDKNLGSISEIEFETIRMQTSQNKQHWQIEKNRTINLKKNIDAQSDVRHAQLNKLKKQLKRLQNQVDDLQIRSPISGVVQDVVVEPGENVSPSNSLAKIVQNDLLIARLLVPEVQAHNVKAGQAVLVDTRKTEVPGVVARVSPSVVDGTVEVDVDITSSLPEEAKPDLSIDAEINIALLEDTIYVARPAYSQNNQKMQIFKLDKDEKIATKTPVTFGRGSASLIEVKSGLKPGEKIIVSDQSALEKYKQLAID